MNVIEKNEGRKIDYEIAGAKICFDDDLTVNLAKRQQDYDVHIDICFDADRNLVIGTAAGRAYVAEIDIPARMYVQNEVEEGEEPEPPTPVPLDIAEVTISLWAIE